MITEKVKVTFENEDGSKKVVMNVGLTSEEPGGDGYMEMDIKFQPEAKKEDNDLVYELAMVFTKAMTGELENVTAKVNGVDEHEEEA